MSKQPKDLFLIRNRIHQSLGLGEEELIEEKYGEDTIRIIESKNESKKGTLKEVTISDLYDSEENTEIKKIWQVNLEKDIPGISTKSKTPETALIVLQEFNYPDSPTYYKLWICLIELKSSLNTSPEQEVKSKKSKSDRDEFEDIPEKFQCGMNRLYMLLTLNDHNNEKKGYRGKDIRIHFKGLVFYNTSRINRDDNEETDQTSAKYLLLNIFEKESKKGTLTLNTLFEEQDKIEVKFIENSNPEQNPNSISVNLQDLLKK